ncbi:MAG: ATP-binding protein [Peptococcaceae bacterium BICA1-8]|nr:MAG: ATP-binding protein [Peptococcaceae bacterium BICA1-8]
MQETPKGSRVHIALLGRRNAGKSSLINALTNQETALVSPVPGTTTDPVYKAMEILPMGPVMLIDTAGIDDEGQLGAMRVEKTLQVLVKTDIVLLVVDPLQGCDSYEEKIIKLCTEKSIPLLIVFNKSDLISDEKKAALEEKYQSKNTYSYFWVSSKTQEGINQLRERLGRLKPNDHLPPSIVGDLLEPGDMVVLVVPIDSAAPKGRLILPQVQTIRDILDHQCMTVVCREHELTKALKALKNPPKLVVTDSQAFHQVARETPAQVPLTSFSILMARYKGDLAILAQGAKAIDNLEPGDKVLIAEACTHHQQHDDIGKVKIPRWLQEKVGGELSIDFTNGFTFPGNLNEYKLVVHCGGCMLNRKDMLNRIRQVENMGIPVVNYGVLIAHIHGIFPRALAPFITLDC